LSVINEKFDPIIWENIEKESENFHSRKPFKFLFAENVFTPEFYNKLYDTYPEIDEKWDDSKAWSKKQFVRGWFNIHYGNVVDDVEDPNLSKEWNKLFSYFHSKEFIEKIKAITRVDVNKLKTFRFVNYRKGGFQVPHIHNDGTRTIIMFFYFSKNWKEGDAGGTYVSSEEDEKTIIFEPYNLDNSMVILHDGPYSAHGVRRITKDVERRAIQIYLEFYSSENGWSGQNT